MQFRKSEASRAVPREYLVIRTILGLNLNTSIENLKVVLRITETYCESTFD